MLTNLVMLLVLLALFLMFLFITICMYRQQVIDRCHTSADIPIPIAGGATIFFLYLFVRSLLAMLGT